MKYFEDLDIGAEFRSPSRTITEADVVRFAAIAGDYQALDPTDGESGLPLVVPELLVFTIISGLGLRIPETQPEILAFMVVDWQFIAPVRVGDTVQCRIRVTGKRPMREGGVLIEKREITNQRNEVVQEAEYKLLVARRPRDGEPVKQLGGPPRAGTGGGVARPPRLDGEPVNDLGGLARGGDPGRSGAPPRPD